MSYNQMPGPQKELLNPPSDRDSDLTSPGSVRSELHIARSKEGDARDVVGPEKLLCQLLGCGRSFDQPNLLKKHIKIHLWECRRQLGVKIDKKTGAVIPPRQAMKTGALFKTDKNNAFSKISGRFKTIKSIANKRPPHH